jgi:hypothetical protein
MQYTGRRNHPHALYADLAGAGRSTSSLAACQPIATRIESGTSVFEMLSIPYGHASDNPDFRRILPRQVIIVAVRIQRSRGLPRRILPTMDGYLTRLLLLCLIPGKMREIRKKRICAIFSCRALIGIRRCLALTCAKNGTGDGSRSPLKPARIRTSLDTGVSPMPMR